MKSSRVVSHLNSLRVLGVAGVAAVVGLGSSPFSPVAQAANLPYSVVRLDTQQSVTNEVIRTNAAESAAVVVTQKEKSFAPATVEIRVGQAIEIVNDDTTVHNAYCSAGDFKYNSGPQQPGSKSNLSFSTPGTYEVRCAIHPKMRLSVTVSP